MLGKSTENKSGQKMDQLCYSCSQNRLSAASELWLCGLYRCDVTGGTSPFHWLPRRVAPM